MANKVDLTQLQNYINNFPKFAEEAGKNAALLAGVALQKEMKATFTNAGPSPSAPGNPPAVDTGNLRRSIQVKQDTANGDVQVGSNIDYARYLEYGTSKMAARPWLNRSYNNAKTEMSRMAKFALEKTYRDFVRKNP